MKKTLISILLLIPIFLFSQQNPIDSLITLIDKTTIDTTKVNLLNEAAGMLRGRDNTKAMDLTKQAIEIAEKHNYKKGIADANKTLGIIYFMIGDFDKAYEASNKSKETYESIGDKNGVAACSVNLGIFNGRQGKITEAKKSYEEALAIYKEIGDNEGSAKIYLNLGNLYKVQGNYKRALDNYYKALEIFEKVDNKSRVAQIFQNIGIVYSEQKEYDKALENYNKALNVFAKLEDLRGIAEVNNNIGNNYADTEEYDLAIDYYLKGLKLFKEIGYTPRIAYSYYNLGDANNKIKNYKKAKEYFDKSLELYKKMNYDAGMAMCYNGLGEYYFRQKQYKKAAQYLEKAKQLSHGADLRTLSDAVEWLSKSYAKTGKYKEAYENHVLFKQYNDSMFNENNEKTITSLALQYEFAKQEEKRILKEKIEKEKQKEIQREKDKVNKIRFIGLFGLFIGALIIAVISVLSYKRKQKANILLKAQKEEIEHQKIELEQSNEEILAQRDEIETKNILITEQRDIALKQKQEITDSIHYAQRIQEAVLPNRKMFVNYIEDYFILFKPKDIVSGDFYWMTRVDDKLIVTAADCTGHGVPGAFMSMLGVTFLNEIVNKDKVLQPSKILDRLREKVISSLHQEDGETKDGMDIAIAVIDTTKKELQFAGAYNPLYLIKKGENEITKIKADRMPIGIHLKMNVNFTNHVIPYNSGDVIYLFSDGYVDQFGGEKGRKLKSKKFQELLLNIKDKPMAEQKEILDKFLLKWRGDLEQLDDIIVIGLRL
ncbi:MAG: tetratricopeptide repeat protein [Chlorobi bacterium]|nr:tetratricopeptide repeat protein [Chlorobiota bacterium]